MDDEGIPFVYAQQLLNHHGLVYSSVADGRVEGYSDFLHVLTGAAVLGLTRALDWPKISVFFLGKCLALAAAVATLLIVFATLRRLKVVTVPGATAGLAFLGPVGAIRGLELFVARNGTLYLPPRAPDLGVAGVFHD